MATFGEFGDYPGAENAGNDIIMNLVLISLRLKGNFFEDARVWYVHRYSLLSLDLWGGLFE